jgi:hypothetical protein
MFTGNTETDKVRIATARNGAKRLKLIRHPNVLVLKEDLEIESGHELTIYVVTEAVQPLEVGLTVRQRFFRCLFVCEHRMAAASYCLVRVQLRRDERV